MHAGKHDDDNHEESLTGNGTATLPGYQPGSGGQYNPVDKEQMYLSAWE